ncbi:uncharacterized protein si:ch1073-126c3.2 [Pseudoliparis swirei]|uniref:uncharacterized protein si:ch1073-126c3.2 n=1 Tax=Pseudoliparis swirei TaxID=2059687 RepID=UPI0024BE3E09|nr:uncharacterized protein si:ch1073-126c3.2 [Pseudoliparis swirei]
MTSTCARPKFTLHHSSGGQKHSGVVVMASSRRTLALLCSLAVLSQGETSSCTSETELLVRLSADLEVAAECGDYLQSAWKKQERAALLLAMRNVTDTLHTHMLRECHGARPEKCPEAEVPLNGGLACVTVADKRYCKPLCNHGYDFAFLRRSRPYAECSERTRFHWETQYVGGNKLAVCHESPIQVSGAKTAYFPEHQDCLTTKTRDPLQSSVRSDLIADLTAAGVQVEESQAVCLVCG